MTLPKLLGLTAANGTRKYVPKLLKEVQNAKVLTADQYDVMEKAKAAAVGKGEVSTEDWEKLRGIGWNCVGRRT